MAYVYLLDLYRHIAERLSEATDALDKACGDPAAGKFEQGRIDVLTEFQKYLQQNFNPKLPRRIRESLIRNKSMSRYPQ
jgi:hypothetical protein